MAFRAEGDCLRRRYDGRNVEATNRSSALLGVFRVITLLGSRITLDVLVESVKEDHALVL